MYFRLSLTIRDLTLHPDGVSPLALVIPGEPSVRVTFREDAETAGQAAVAETELEPGRRRVEAFKYLAAGKLPPGHPPREEWARDFDYITPDGTIRDRYIVPLWLMPPGVQEFARELSTAMYGAADRAVGILRWRSGVLGPPRPFATRGIDWSFDGDDWHPMPSNTSVRVHEEDRIEISEAAAEQMQQLLDAGNEEPLAHELFREAWSLRFDAPRSSLLICMTALEVGVKHYISACVPGATWLAFEAPSPPVERLLRDYVPTLAPPDGEAPVQIDAEILAELKKSVPIRNGLAHKGAEVPPHRLAKTLRAVRNTLWAFDKALGRTWAYEHRFQSLDDDLPTGYKNV